MSQKTVNFSHPKQKANEWVTQQAQEDALTKRVSFDLTEEEHRQLKTQCAQQGLKMTDLFRGWVNQFIEQKV